MISRNRFPPRADLEYDFDDEGGYAGEVCAVCRSSACEIRVRWWETAHKPIKPTQFVREGRSQSHFFCIDHRAVSERVYVHYTTMKQKPAATASLGARLAS